MKRKNVAIMTVILLITILVIYSLTHILTMRTRSKAQLLSVTDNLNKINAQINNSFNNQFMKVGISDITHGCEEYSPEISFTREYDCEVSYQVNYQSKHQLSNDEVRQLIDTFLAQTRSETANTSMSTETYSEFMVENGSWQNTYIVPNSGVADVSQTNYADAVGLANVHIDIDSKFASVNRDVTKLNFSVTQRYASCQSFFIACNPFISK